MRALGGPAGGQVLFPKARREQRETELLINQEKYIPKSPQHFHKFTLSAEVATETKMHFSSITFFFIINF